MSPSGKAAIALAILFGSLFLPVFSVRAMKKLGVARDEAHISFANVLAFAKEAMPDERTTIFKAACDTTAFTCEEIMQLASFGSVDWGLERWSETVMIFAQGRANKGCISDPHNAELIVRTFEEKMERQWAVHPDDMYHITHFFLVHELIYHNDAKEPAKDVGSLHIHLQTGLRTDEAMAKLLTDLDHMMHASWFYQIGSSIEKEFTDWLKHIRADGEQFSGRQLVNLVNALKAGCLAMPSESLAHAVSVLLNSLEQYLTGVTCNHVLSILRSSTRFNTLSPRTEQYRTASLIALRSSITDGQNKAAIVADRVVQMVGVDIANQTGEALRNVGVGLPPQNNPIFGVVRGNPVIFVVDESDTMDVTFTLGNDTLTRRRFCHSQLEIVLEGLPRGTHFNVIQYGSSTVKLFRDPVLISRTSIDAAMDKVSSTWRDDYTPGRDPVVWLHKIHGFSLKFQRQFFGSTKKPMEALQLAFATEALPSQQSEKHTRRDYGSLVVDVDTPQIYFLTSGPPDGGAGQTLDKIDQFDNGRNIPVNSIVFSNASADLLAKKFGKDLARKTGGFFRSIEQA